MCDGGRELITSRKVFCLCPCVYYWSLFDRSNQRTIENTGLEMTDKQHSEKNGRTGGKEVWCGWPVGMTTNNRLVSVCVCGQCTVWSGHGQDAVCGLSSYTVNPLVHSFPFWDAIRNLMWKTPCNIEWNNVSFQSPEVVSNRANHVYLENKSPA